MTLKYSNSVFMRLDSVHAVNVWLQNIEISYRNKQDLNYWYDKNTHEFIKINNARFN